MSLLSPTKTNLISLITTTTRVSRHWRPAIGASMSPVRSSKFGHCRERDWGTHPATHRTGYCDHHHVEFALVKARWRSARNNFRRGASKADPGPWPEYFAAHARFTDRDRPVPTAPSAPADRPDTAETRAAESLQADGPAGIVLDPEVQDQLKRLADGLETSLNAFQKRAINIEGAPFTRLWAATVENRVDVMKAAAAALRAVAAGEAPTGPWPRGTP